MTTNVSFVIPTYNGVHLLQKHLRSVFAAARKGDEIIIVDDASTDESVAWLEKTYGLTISSCEVTDAFCSVSIYKGVGLKVLINRTNRRFASSCNRGVMSAKAELVVLLNNDVSPDTHFLASLLPHFEDPDVFAVGCKELAASENDKEYGRSSMTFSRGMFIHWREPDQSGTDTAWVAGGSGMFRKSMWEELGGFDLDYTPAYWEDIDLSWRAKQRGWKVLFEPASIVHHVHESTNASVFGKNRVEIMGYKNQLLFTWKHAKGGALVSHIFWFPYHLVFTTIRSRGRFAIGLWRASIQVLLA
ncbi:hypothetical protein C5B42_00795 [Candidatus Cerribacteria bacterium 'Amazon FNV 2010 28 9']|uniref:Glycosyltransferase 2-like domain-containing protein n=1 Tax=Candidatus Cerribacteria bacterium 'Amazon FNV 2010 28 9' TaxID=2081795 RepID=A0A317JSJ7_9BACT|nr:MAG: hypothetical protein C5B42_00795 [Candidatus Cerribacteria bacterium 'Amazon FNV 2010 28 9']